MYFGFNFGFSGSYPLVVQDSESPIPGAIISVEEPFAGALRATYGVSTDNVEVFQVDIEISSNNIDWSTLESNVPIGGGSTSIIGLGYEVTRWFRVKAIDTSSNIAYSTSVSGTTAEEPITSSELVCFSFGTPDTGDYPVPDSETLNYIASGLITDLVDLYDVNGDDTGWTGQLTSPLGSGTAGNRADFNNNTGFHFDALMSYGYTSANQTGVYEYTVDIDGTYELTFTGSRDTSDTNRYLGVIVNSETKQTLNIGDNYTNGITFSDITPDANGKIFVYYDSPDSGAGYLSSQTIQKTSGGNQQPVITILGDNPATQIVGSTYTDAGATASDPEDGNITADIVPTSDVDADTIGVYSVDYNVVDSESLAADEKTRVVNIISDSESDLPTIYLSMGEVHPAPPTGVTINEIGNVFPIALVDENNNPTGITLSVNSEVSLSNTDAPVSGDNSGFLLDAQQQRCYYNGVNDYTMTLSSLDPSHIHTFRVSGSTVNANRYVKYTMNGNVTEFLATNNLDTGATETDITGVTSFDIIVGTPTQGDTFLRYVNGMDILRNGISKPSITILGSNPATVVVGNTYTDSGATAYDAVDGDITDDITTSDDIDTETIGAYSVEYSVTNSNSQTTITERVVNVIAETGENIYLEEVNIPTYDSGNSTHCLIGTTAGSGWDSATLNSSVWKHFYLPAGTYGNIVLTRDGSSADRRSLSLYPQAETHPASLSVANQADVKLQWDDASHWDIDRISFLQYQASNIVIWFGGGTNGVTDSGSCHNVLNRINLKDYYYGITAKDQSNYNTIQKSYVDTMTTNGRSGDCIGIALINAGVEGVRIYGTKIISNDIRNACDGIQLIRSSYSSTEDISFPDTIIDDNNVWCDTEVRTDGTGTYDVDGEYNHAEDAMDFKVGSDDPAKPVVITNNRMWGYRNADGSFGGTTDFGGGGVVVFHYGCFNTIFNNNIVFDSLKAFTYGNQLDVAYSFTGEMKNNIIWQIGYVNPRNRSLYAVDMNDGSDVEWANNTYVDCVSAKYLVSDEPNGPTAIDDNLFIDMANGMIRTGGVTADGNYYYDTSNKLNGTNETDGGAKANANMGDYSFQYERYTGSPKTKTLTDVCTTATSPHNGVAGSDIESNV